MNNNDNNADMCSYDYIDEKFDKLLDDMVFLHDDYQFLKELFEKIKLLLKEKLCLDIKPNYQLFYTCDRGIDFCGYVINHNYMKIRRRTRDKYIKKSKKYRYEKMNNHNRSSFYSYIGFLKHANTYNLQNKYSKPVMKNWLQRYDEIQTRRNNYQK